MDNNQLMCIINQNLGIHKNHCKTFIDFIVALQKSRTVNLQQMVNYSSKIGNIKETSIYKGYQRIVHENKLTQTAIASCGRSALIELLNKFSNRLYMRCMWEHINDSYIF